jgi:cytoskeletal protein CcmA (bactofilin family)
VRGDVRAARLVIDEGAQFDGRVSMTEIRQPGQSY